jgi:hypothetical protein
MLKGVRKFRSWIASKEDIHLAAHILDHDSADAERVGRSLGVLDLSVLVLVLLHDAVHVFGSIVENIIEAEDN